MDEIVMEQYWYYFISFTFSFLEAYITQSEEELQIYEGKLYNPLIVTIFKYLDQFLDRGNI